jgi:hypothetical protein
MISSGYLCVDTWTDSFTTGSFWSRVSRHPVSTRGLINEDMLSGPPAADKEDLELRARIPQGLCSLMNILLHGLNENAASFVKLGSIMQEAPLDERHQMAILSELRLLIEELIILLDLGLRLMGVMLCIIVPLTLFVFTVVNQPLLAQAPRLASTVTDVFDLALVPLDRLLSPLLRLTARGTGLTGETEPLFENTNVHEIINRAKRIILGMLVLNVLASIVMLLILLVFVLLVRHSGVMGH